MRKNGNGLEKYTIIWGQHFRHCEVKISKFFAPMTGIAFNGRELDLTRANVLSNDYIMGKSD